MVPSERSMSAESKDKQALIDGGADDGNSDETQSAGHPHLSAQVQRDEEIAAMEAHSRHQPPTIQRPPELPPAPPRKALAIVGVLLLVLILAGAVTLILRASHERALAKETELETIPTVAVVHPLAEKPDEDLVLPGSLLAFEESPIMRGPVAI